MGDPGSPLLVLPHLRQVRGVAVSADGRIATASHDHTVRVWDADTGKALTGPLRHRQGAFHVAFEPSGRLLASASADGTARLWDSVSGRQVGPPLLHRRVVMTVGFDPSGRRLLSCSRDGTARLWPVPAPLSGAVERIVLWTEAVTGKTLDAGGAVRFLDLADWQRRHRARQYGEPWP
jgi:WD40 repeat protein